MKRTAFRSIWLMLALMLAVAAFGCGGDDDDDDSDSGDDDLSPDDDAADDDAADDDTTGEVVPTTLDVTYVPQQSNGEWALVQGPGEPHQGRNDLHVKATRKADSAPLSLTYFVTYSDLHLADEESPARLTFFDSNFIFDGMFESAFRPQEDLAGQMLNALVRMANRIQTDYGRDFDFALVLGDATDNAQTNEMKTLIDILDGDGLLSGEAGWARVDSGEVIIDSSSGRNLGERDFDIQENNLEGQNINPFNRNGYPNSNADFATPGLVQSGGSAVPWFYVMGNHDVQNMGVFMIDSPLGFYYAEDYVSDWSPFGLLPGLADLVTYWKENPLQPLHIGSGLLHQDLDWRIAMFAADAAGMIEDNYLEDAYPGFELLRLLANTPDVAADDGAAVAPDTGRAFLGRVGTMELMEKHGHGFADRPVADLGYYRLDWSQIQPGSDLPLRLLMLDSTEKEIFSNGGVSEAQLAWLTAELDQAVADEVLVVVTSHYYLSSINENGDALEALLASYPNVFLLLDGHGHYNVVEAHPGTGDSAGFWEVQTPSDIDFPQQSRIFEIVDNRDGTGTVYVTLYDHWPTANDDADTLAELGRDLGFYDALAARPEWNNTTPLAGAGTVTDRNVALTFAIPDAIATKLAALPSSGEITSVDSLGQRYQP